MRRDVKKFSNKRRGSTSAFLVVMLLLIVCIAVLSISVSNSSYKLSKRMGEYVSGYYELDSIAVESASQILEMLEFNPNDLCQLAQVDLGDKILFLHYKMEQEAEGYIFEYEVYSKPLDRTMQLKYKVVNQQLDILTWRELPRDLEIDHQLFEEVE